MKESSPSSRPSAVLDPAEPGVLALGSATAFSESGIVSRTLLAAPPLRVVLFGFAAGQELTDHASPSRALVQILSGTCEFTLGNDCRRLAAGDLVHLPPGAPHAVRALEPFSMLLTLVKDNPA